MKHKAIITLTALSVLTTSASVFAANADFTSTTKNTSNIPVKSVSYDYDDYDDDIEIDFSSRIQLKPNAKVKVKDNTGKVYKSYIEDYDSDEIDLDIANLNANRNYTVTIKGIKNSTASKYGKLKIKFNIPKASTNLVKEVDYDADDREVSFEFKNRVSYSNPTVVITNTSNTKTYPATIIERDNDELSVRVSGLTRGATYKYKITGVINQANGSNKTLSGTFTAVDHD